MDPSLHNVSANRIPTRRAPMATMVAVPRTKRRDRARSHGFPSSDPQLDEAGPSSRPASGNDASETIVQRKPKKKTRTEQPALPSMLRNLFPYNEGPEIGVEMASSAEPQGKLTRTNVQEYRHRVHGDPIPKRRSLNVRGMFRDQLKINHTERRSEKVSRPSLSVTGVDDQTPTTLHTSVNSSDKPLSDQTHDTDVSNAWLCWKNKNSKFLDCVHSGNRTPLPNLNHRENQQTFNIRHLQRDWTKQPASEFRGRQNGIKTLRRPYCGREWSVRVDAYGQSVLRFRRISRDDLQGYRRHARRHQSRVAKGSVSDY